MQFENLLRVDDGGIDLQTVADDARILEQARAVFGGIFCDLRNFESAVGFAEVIRFFQDRDPRQPRLVDLEDQPLEEFVVAFQGESILSIVVVFVECIFRVGVAIVTVGGHAS